MFAGQENRLDRSEALIVFLCLCACLQVRTSNRGKARTAFFKLLDRTKARTANSTLQFNLILRGNIVVYAELLIDVYKLLVSCGE